MVTRSTGDCQSVPWQRDLAQAFTQVDPLLRFLGLTRDQIPDLDPAPGPFRLLVPRAFAALMAPGDAADPLLHQVLPRRQETVITPGFHRDPVGDGPATRSPGLLHKYQGRALLMAHGACAVHCRYCFRRHFPYASLSAYGRRVTTALEQNPD